MVIYLQLRKVIIYRILIVIFLISLICTSGYFIGYLKYNDRRIVDIEALRIENRALQSELKEIKNLKGINSEYIIGKIIVRNIHDFYNEIVVNLGSEDNISIGDTVISGDGLVGIVSKVEKNKSYVKLLTSDYNVSVKINDTYGNLNHGRVTLLDKYSELNVGDKVYTSGYSGMIEGIYVGEVVNVFMDSNNLGKEVEVKLVDNKNLNYVSIIRGLS